MKEDFLHYIWKFKKFKIQNLQTTAGESIIVTSVGQHNLNSGPDFFNAKLSIDKQLWAGNVEIHVKSSDWFLHNHEKDTAYDNVILHVVWEHDVEVFRKDNSPIPTLVLKDCINFDLLSNYTKLFAKSNAWINCENEFASVDKFVVDNWLERLYFERLERKSKDIEALLKASNNNWEAVLFKMLAKNFGLKVNGDAFLSLSESIDFSIIRKVQSNKLALEALLFGQAGLLAENIENGYYSNLVSEYNFLKQKFLLKNHQVLSVQYFRLRPLNFPTIRLSQLASLYHAHQNLFSKIIETNKVEDLYQLLKVETSVFWETHYTFGKESSKATKALSKSFMDLLILNTILPITFAFAKFKGETLDDQVIALASKIKLEKNSITDAFNRLSKPFGSALKSQALIQLKTAYCDKNKCLQCAIGNSLINK